jgi:hypothetical protein
MTTDFPGLLMAMALAAYACSAADTDSGGSGGTGGTSADVCEAAFARELACGSETEAGRVAYMESCGARLACQQQMADPAYIAEYWPCANARDCEANDDWCVDPFLLDRLDDPVVGPAYEQCMTRRAECCPSTPCAFNDDYCASILLFNEPSRAEYAECLAMECSEIEMCFSDVQASHGCYD